jgi:hypothetical protein
VAAEEAAPPRDALPARPLARPAARLEGQGRAGPAPARSARRPDLHPGESAPVFHRSGRTVRETEARCAQIDEAAWSSLYSTVSRPFAMPDTGKIAVKVINHYGDEVLKVFEI